LDKLFTKEATGNVIKLSRSKTKIRFIFSGVYDSDLFLYTSSFKIGKVAT
jgi:hypothetical protein